MRFDPLVKRTPATLVGTLRPAEANGGRLWQLLLGVLALVFGRALLYWYLAGPVDWTPKLNLGFIVLAFRNDQFSSELVFSVLSFLRVALIFYFWLIVLGLLQRATADTEPIGRWLRLHLSRYGRWPWPVQLLLPVLVVPLLWAACYPLLVQLGVSNPAHSLPHLFMQGLLVSLELCLSLKYLLVPLLVIEVVVSYVYLGNSPVWEFINGTTRTLLSPARAVPLQLRRLDLAPVLGALLLLLLLHWVPLMVQNAMARHQVSLWPQ